MLRAHHSPYTLVVLEQYEDLVHNPCHLLEVSVGDHHRSMGHCSQGSLSEDALHVEMAGRVVGSIDHDVVGDLWHSLAGSCGRGRGGNAARIPRCDRMSC